MKNDSSVSKAAFAAISKQPLPLQAESKTILFGNVSK